MVKLLGSRCFSQKTGRIISEQVAELIRIRNKFRNIAFAEFTVNLPSQGILSQKRPFLERQMIPGCTNVGITPSWF